MHVMRTMFIEIFFGCYGSNVVFYLYQQNVRILILDKLIKYSRIVHTAEAILHVKIDRLKGFCYGVCAHHAQYMHHQTTRCWIRMELYTLCTFGSIIQYILPYNRFYLYTLSNIRHCFGPLVMIYELMT